MVDPDILKAAKILVEHSARVKKNEHVQIITSPEAKDLALEVYKRVLQKGAYPQLHVGLPGANYIYYKYASDEQLKKFPDIAFHELKKTHAVIYLAAPTNTRELSNIDPKVISLRQKITRPYSNYRVKNTKWVIFDYPVPALAQEADMSLEEYRQFVFRATNRNWNKDAKFQNKLKKILDKGKEVKIIGKDTNIRLSIKGRTAITCTGEHNMPDGEVFMGPVETETEGHIRYTYPAIYAGKEVSNVYLEFKKGKVVKATADKNQDLLKTLINSDPGASMLGELGIGTNYNVNKFTKNILFDEKIGGTIHLALGMAYKEGGGRNNSSIHWDMVKDLRKNGAIYVDGRCIQKNGKFKI